MLELLVAGAMLVAVLLFALAGGADFGGGIWTLLARGERREDEARLVDEAVGPVWEANELWIVVAIVILWAGFTEAFVAFGIALFVPLILTLAGILLRGAFFAFQHEAPELPVRGAFTFFGKAFGAFSIVSPIFFGVAAGTIASGRLSFDQAGPQEGRFATGVPAEGYFQPWLGPFPLLIGVLALITCAYLAAVYLTLEAAGDEELREIFRRRGIISGVALFLVGVLAFPAAAVDAEYMWRGLSSFPALGFMFAAAAALAASVALLAARRFWWARTAAILEVVAVFGAWASAQYPYLLVDDITVRSAASPGSVLVGMLVLSFFYAVVLGPSLVLMLRIFKSSGSRSGGHP